MLAQTRLSLTVRDGGGKAHIQLHDTQINWLRFFVANAYMLLFEVEYFISNE